MTKRTKDVGPGAAPGRDRGAADALARFARAAQAFEHQHTRTKAAAMAQLRKAGIITRTGRLTKAFGG